MKMSAQSLADQIKLTDREIETRRRLFGITEKDEKILNQCAPYIERRVESVVENFYEYQLSIPDIDLLIGDAETLRRIKSAITKYVRDLFGGYYDSEYVNKRLRIGKVHKRIGLPTKFYISTVNVLIQLLNEELESLVATETVAVSEKEIQDSLRKLLMFDIQLVFDTYINSLIAEVEIAKAEVEDYAASLEETVANRTRQLEQLSRKDPLSNLLNQRAFYDELRRESARARREEQPLCLVYIDLNGFKEINDTRGHQAGDHVIQSVSGIIAGTVRVGDIPCRYGGDEFCIVMPGCEADEAAGVCDRLFEALAKNGTADVSMSVGVVQSGPIAYFDMEEMIRCADTAMYKAKSAARANPGNYVEIA